MAQSKTQSWSIRSWRTAFTYRAPGYNCKTPWFMGPSIHPRLKKPVRQRLALGTMQTAYGKGSGVYAGVIAGCTSTGTAAAAGGKLTLSFDVSAGRKLSVGPYSRSNPSRSATAVLVNTTWYPVHINAGEAPWAPSRWTCRRCLQAPPPASGMHGARPTARTCNPTATTSRAAKVMGLRRRASRRSARFWLQSRWRRSVRCRSTRSWPKL